MVDRRWEDSSENNPALLNLRTSLCKSILASTRRKRTNWSSNQTKPALLKCLPRLPISETCTARCDITKTGFNHGTFPVSSKLESLAPRLEKPKGTVAVGVEQPANDSVVQNSVSSGKQIRERCRRLREQQSVMADDGICDLRYDSATGRQSRSKARFTGTIYFLYVFVSNSKRRRRKKHVLVDGHLLIGVSIFDGYEEHELCVSSARSLLDRRK